MRIFKKLICKFKGHSYPGLVRGFSSNVLYFCERCGKEYFDRTFEDLEPMTEEERDYWTNHELYE